ncbi:ABC transporter permease [Parabacteroides gordonii]|nr:ABC transporter permease [Parabacteroides gordonii]
MSKKTQKAVYLEASKYISDLTKLIFGGIILTNILNFNIDKVIIFVVGTIAIIGFVILSLLLFLKGKE